MRTFTRSELDRARAAWDEGEFSSEWRDVRHRAAMGGLIYPPSGSKWDSWDDDEPSQRAVLIRAIRETPRLLDKCLVGARSWSEVVERLFRARDDWRARMREEDEPTSDKPTHGEATRTIAGILDRIWQAR